MRFSKLVGERYKERPSDCTVDSHAFMVRGGYIKQVNTGVFSLLPPGKRIMRKIEQIVREEMDAVGGQEVLFPVVLPASLWEESGRYDSVGDELLRVTDRNGSKMVLGMTHEEAAVHLVRDSAQTYTKYPFMIYQIQTKFRDEPRARGGLIRVREFTMKDAYSFHTSQEDLESYYDECFKAYERIFARAGIPQVVDVASDSGMMGGNVSHEFMLLTEIGEDRLAICPECGYRANVEAAETLLTNEAGEITDLTLVHTPDQKTIEDVAAFLHMPSKATAKAVVYQKDSDDGFVVVFLRGDLEVNETKLRNYLGEDIHPGKIEETSPLVEGFIGPVDFPKEARYIVDRSLEGINSLVCGANKKDYHYTGLNLARDVGNVAYVDVAKAVTGGICPGCKKPVLTIQNGIEVGNIFQLGRKYTESMHMQYVDEKGERQHPIMGCYGIGIGRLAASVCEVNRDQYGPIWPMSIAPWQVHLCAMRIGEPAVREAAEALYNTLETTGIEVLFDDRELSPGKMFSEADLLGIPLRVVVSPRGLEAGTIEIATRDKSLQTTAPVAEAPEAIAKLVRDMLSAQGK